jgi:UDP-sugar pyrophosphorylase|eukprot:g8066.t1
MAKSVVGTLQQHAKWGALTSLLVGAGQTHLFEGWDLAEEDKVEAFFDQIQKLEDGYPGGLVAYVNQAKRLLQASKRGDNPFEGFVPEIPSGATLHFDSEEYNNMEQVGLQNASFLAFVLVAGGLGERLGYSGIKVALPSEITTEDCYLKLYIHSILALQRATKATKPLPLVMMTSGDTHDRTVELLETNGYFGMEKGQITLLKQEKVASIENDAGAIARSADDIYSIQTKPHGHGDVHYLLHSSGTAHKWLAEGRKYILFFQDTNGLVFRSLLAALGVAVTENFSANSITGSRGAKEAMGAICRLRREDGTSITTNVEYNQLDPLLRASGHPDGDVNGEDGFSPYPGNMNQLLFRVDDYVSTLDKTEGLVPEFVNPKYADEAKTKFKKPTRLECMMQDLPRMFGSESLVGFTTIIGNGLGKDREDRCAETIPGMQDTDRAIQELRKPMRFYSPVKNNVVDAAKKQRAGTHPSCAASGEADLYATNAKMLIAAGVVVGAPLHKKWPGPNGESDTIETMEWPHVVLSPSISKSMASLRKCFVDPEQVKISSRSTLVLSGPGTFVVKKLDLDGALVLKTGTVGATVVVDATVKNDGHLHESLYTDGKASGAGVPEYITIRGYSLLKKQEKIQTFNEDGEFEVA